MNKSDLLIKLLLNDIRYKVNINGYIETTVPPKGSGKVPWRIIPTNKTFQGYHRITFKGNTLQLHRIIYTAFNGPIHSGMIINHIDGNPSNNNSCNLEQLSQGENVNRSKNRICKKRIYSESFKNLVREDHEKGLSYRELSLKYSIAKGTVYNFLIRSPKKLVA